MSLSRLKQRAYTSTSQRLLLEERLNTQRTGSIQKPVPLRQRYCSSSHPSYNIPFVESTLPAKRSSSVVAWSNALASALKMASIMW